VIVLTAIFAEVLAPYDRSPRSRRSAGRPSWEHPFGTTTSGATS